MKDMKIRINVDNKLSLSLRFAILLQTLVFTQSESESQSYESSKSSSLGVVSNRDNREALLLLDLLETHSSTPSLKSFRSQFVSKPKPISESVSLAPVSLVSGDSSLRPVPIAERQTIGDSNNRSNGCRPISGHSMCSCYALEDGLLIECNITAIYQMKDVLNLLISQPIKSFSVYSINQTLNSLPESLFQNFSSIEQIYISLPSLASIPVQTFEGLETSLKTLSLVNSKLKSIPKQALNKLRSLETLDLESNIIEEVESYAFNGSPLVSLNLQSNKINSFVEFSFGGLEETLVELVLIGNRVERFPLHALTRLSRLETLKLQSNHITSILDDGVTRLNSLISLDLHSNRIYQLDSRSFLTVPKLVSLSVANNTLTSLSDSTIFEHLLDLETLDLSHNHLLKVDLNNLIGLRTIDLSHNHLESIIFDNLPNLKEIFVSHNNILELTNETFLNCSTLSVIFLQHNAIQSIDYNAFNSLHNLLTLDLSSNQLKAIDPQLLKYNTRLQSLYADHNLIYELPQLSADLQSLQHLDFSYNRLTRVVSFGSIGHSVQYISVRHNMIGSIADEAFQNMTSLETIDIRENFLTQLNPNVFESIEVHLESVMLSGNPFECNCKLLQLLEWLESHPKVLSLTDRQELTCAQPEKLKDSSIMSLHAIDLCPLPLISLIEISKLEPTQVRISWELNQNNTLSGGFTLEYYLTSNRTHRTPPVTQKFFGPHERSGLVTQLSPEHWYTICITANGKYVKREETNKPSPYVSEEHKSFAEYVTTNRKCTQVRTLSHIERTFISVSLGTLGIIVTVVVFVVLILTLCILYVVYKFRTKRRRPLKSQVPEEYITYRHFSLPSSENVYS